jgi:P-type E1-E2 ATPase
MLEVIIPGRGAFRLEHLVLDVNGTLALDGQLLPGVAERLMALRESLSLHLLSADTHGQLDAIAAALTIPATRLAVGQPEAEQKAAFVRQLGAGAVAAIGNGANDVGMLRAAALRIAVLGPEGLATEALVAADVLVGSILDALDLLRSPRRLIATLRR